MRGSTWRNILTGKKSKRNETLLLKKIELDEYS
jgi:hypothetical protein